MSVKTECKDAFASKIPVVSVVLNAYSVQGISNLSTSGCCLSITLLENANKHVLLPMLM